MAARPPVLQLSPLRVWTVDEIESWSPRVVKPPEQPCHYLVLSRGQWDAHVSPRDVQHAIDRFHAWYERNIALRE